MPDPRFLPMVPTSFALDDDEGLPRGLSRITLAQFDDSIGRLVQGDDRGSAVHETRKALKRLRAVLRLVRGEIGNQVFRAENVELRDTSRMLAPLRDGWVALDAVGELRGRFSRQLRSNVFEELEHHLRARHERQMAWAERSEIVPTVVRRLRSARARFAAWPTEDGALARAYGRKPIGSGFAAIRPGLERTYGSSRRWMERALSTRSGEDLHEWRKQVKYLRHQMELLEPLWPEVVGGYARGFDELSELLGEEHDLLELLRLVAQLPELCPDPVERSLLAALAHQRRSELQQAAFVRGGRLFGETAPAFTKRMAAYWPAGLRG